MNSVTSLVTIENNVPLADSREIAKSLGIAHRSFFKMITEYQQEIEEDFGTVRIQIAPKTGAKAKAGGDQPKYALLTEDQTYAYLAYSQNTEQARACKRKLVKAFSEARTQLFNQIAQQSAPLPLPEPLFETALEAFRAEPQSECPTQEELEAAIIATVQLLQPHRKRGVPGSLLIRYSQQIQTYMAIYGAGGFLAVAESLVERQMLTREELNGAYYYQAPVVTGYLN